MFRLSDFKRALHQLTEPPHPRAERQTVSGLVAHFAAAAAPTTAGIKDISTTGIFLVTEERVPIGELLTLTLQKAGETEYSSDLQVSVLARVERQEEDGIGLSFVPPEGLDPDMWEVLLRGIALLTDRVQIAHVFLTFRTLLFICRLCQSEAKEAIALLGGELDSDRTETLIKIALVTENLLASQPDAERMRAHPKLVANILRQGSWAPDKLNRQLWAGLLASSCSVDAPDDSNQILVNLLIHVAPVQARILSYACERALGSAPGAENSPSGSIILNPLEMVELTGRHDLSRNATDVAYLFNLGLIQKLFNFTSYLPTESFDITPTSLGLALYKHCHGSREKLEPHLVEAASAHLHNFLFEPQPSDADDSQEPSPLPASGS